MKYYITIDKDDIIWGIGHSPEESIEHAKKRFSLIYPKKRLPKLKTAQSTKELFDLAKDNHYFELRLQEDWIFDHQKNIAHIVKRPNVFKTLP